MQITGGTDALVSFMPKDRRVGNDGERVTDPRPWYGYPFGSLSNGVNPYDDTANEGLYSHMTCGRDDPGSYVHCVCRLHRSRLQLVGCALILVGIGVGQIQCGVREPPKT